jgi:hypothetical protein
MKAVEDRNYVAGCLALLLVAGGALWLMLRDPEAGERSARAAALREECVSAGRAAFRARHPGTPMSREQAADLVAGCFREARRKSAERPSG